MVKGTIINTITQELVLTGEQIAQIEGLVIVTVTQEPVSTKEKTKETMVDTIPTRPLEENFVVDTTPQGPAVDTEPPKEGVEDSRSEGENSWEVEKPQEKGFEDTIPQGPVVTPEPPRKDMVILRPKGEDVRTIPRVEEQTKGFRVKQEPDEEFFDINPPNPRPAMRLVEEVASS